VIVEVTGATGSYPDTQSVELAVSTTRKEIFRRKNSLPVLGTNGHTYSAFWLYDTGCAPLRISAALLGQADPSRHVASIPFECGE
jgi:hypothetical protein